MAAKLTLNDHNPVAAGAQKTVYKHPEMANTLIKITKAPSDSDKRAFWGIPSRLPRYWEYACQIIEHLAIREYDPEDALYIENVMGLVDTDLGVGLLVEAIETGDGELAPTIRHIIDKSGRLTDDQQRGFEDLLVWAKRSNTIIRDFSTNNIVWNEETNRFVVIDGIGAKSILSLRNFWRFYNRQTNIKKADKLKIRVEILLGSS